MDNRIKANPIKLAVKGVDKRKPGLIRTHVQRGQNTNIDPMIFDGYMFDELTLAARLTKQEDFDELIKFLQIHKHCFNKTVKTGFTEIEPPKSWIGL